MMIPKDWRALILHDSGGLAALNSEKLDLPISAAMFPDMDEDEGTVEFRDRDGDIVQTASFVRDSIGRLIRTTPDVP